MGRFFKPSGTQFIDDYIYQPPWELIQQAAAQKQKTHDEVVATAALLENIPIESLQGEDDLYNVKEKQRYYNESAQNIVKGMQENPLRAQEYLNKMDSLKRELQTDMTSGDLSKIIGSAKSLQQFREQYKTMREKFPTRYAAAENFYLSEYANAGGNSLAKPFTGGVVTPDLDYEGIRKSLSELKANKIKSTRKTPAGNLYMVETEKGVVEMSKDKMNGWMLSQLLTPENLASLHQSEKFGLGTYRDDEGNIDYDRGSLFAPFRGFAETGSYFEVEDAVKYSEDGAAIANLAHTRWQVDRNDRLIKEEQERIAANAKTKQDKIDAYDIEIAKGLIEGGAEGQRRVTIFTNAKSQLLGTSGLYNSDAGSKYANLGEAAKAARTDPAAKKLIEQFLPNALKDAGINFKDPKQQAVAKEAVDAVIMGKVSLADVGDYVANKIPTVKGNLNSYDMQQAKVIGNRKYNEAIKPMNTQIKDLQSRIQDEKSLIKSHEDFEASMKRRNSAESLKKDTWYQEEMKKREVLKKRSLDKIRDMENQIGGLNKKISSTDKNKYFKEAETEVRGAKPDLNANYRGTFTAAVNRGLEKAQETFTEKRQFSTTYETASLPIIAQAQIINLLRDENNRKEVTIEDGTDTKELDESTFKKIQNITSIIAPDGFGRYGVIGIDKNGKQYKITANVGTPMYQAMFNIAKDNTNLNSLVGQVMASPTAAILKQRIEAGKFLGQSNSQFNITSAAGNTYTIRQVGNTDRYNIYDDHANLRNRTGPVNYLEAGATIDRADNKNKGKK